MPEWWHTTRDGYYAACQMLIGAGFATKGMADIVALVRGLRGREPRRIAMLSPSACTAGCLALFGVAIAALAARHRADMSAIDGAIIALGSIATAADVLLSRRLPQSEGPRPEANALQFASPNYKVAVALNGCLTHLVIRRASFLLSRPGIAHGACFFQRVPLALARLERPTENVIIASGEVASVRYEFEADRMTWTLTNRTARPLSFIFAFSHAVHAVMDETGELRKPPVERHCAVSTWFAGMASLRITGSTRLWGPWSDKRQVWTADLAPGETREVLLEINAASDVDVARAMGWWRVFGRTSSVVNAGHTG